MTVHFFDSTERSRIFETLWAHRLPVWLLREDLVPAFNSNEDTVFVHLTDLLVKKGDADLQVPPSNLFRGNAPTAAETERFIQRLLWLRDQLRLAWTVQPRFVFYSGDPGGTNGNAVERAVCAVGGSYSPERHLSLPVPLGRGEFSQEAKSAISLILDGSPTSSGFSEDDRLAVGLVLAALRLLAGERSRQGWTKRVLEQRELALLDFLREMTGATKRSTHKAVLAQAMKLLQTAAPGSASGFGGPGADPSSASSGSQDVRRG